MNTTTMAPLAGGTQWFEDEPQPQAPTLEGWEDAVAQCADIEEALRTLDPWETEEREALVAELKDWRRERDRIGKALGL